MQYTSIYIYNNPKKYSILTFKADHWSLRPWAQCDVNHFILLVSRFMLSLTFQCLFTNYRHYRLQKYAIHFLDFDIIVVKTVGGYCDLWKSFKFYKCTQLIWSLHWEGLMFLLFDNFLLLFAKVSHFFFKAAKIKSNKSNKGRFPLHDLELTFLHDFYVPKLSWFNGQKYQCNNHPTKLNLPTIESHRPVPQGGTRTFLKKKKKKKSMYQLRMEV